MDELEKKRKEFTRVRAELLALEEEDRIANAYPEAKKREGTYEKFRNCFSSPTSDRDYWWLYCRILEVRETGELIYDEIQIDKNGRLEARSRVEGSWHYGRTGWEPATEGEWVEIVNQAKALLGTLS